LVRGCGFDRRKDNLDIPLAEGFFHKLLAHELGYIIFREFVGQKTMLPLWLDEGVAVLQEEEIDNYKKGVKQFLKLDLLMPVEELNKINKETLILPGIFYAQSVSIVDYLLGKFGKKQFTRFCRCLRDGSRLEEAMAAVYRFKDLRELNQAWLEYLKASD
jgi:hypothetical protein